MFSWIKYKMQLQRSICGIASRRPGCVTFAPLECTYRPSKKKSITNRDVKLMSSAVPLLSIAAVDAIYQILQPPAEYFQTLSLPEPLVHWGHPGNMAVVLFAMGGYGAAYLGWQIRTSSDEAVVAKAKEAHPKIAAGMFIFFALGAVGGMMSLIMQGKPIFESNHVWTGLVGLGLLGVQSLLPLAFATGSGQARTAHAYLGAAIMALFVVHAALGLQLGLSI